MSVQHSPRARAHGLAKGAILGLTPILALVPSSGALMLSWGQWAVRAACTPGTEQDSLGEALKEAVFDGPFAASQGEPHGLQAAGWYSVRSQLHPMQLQQLQGSSPGTVPCSLVSWGQLAAPAQVPRADEDGESPQLLAHFLILHI